MRTFHVPFSARENPKLQPYSNTQGSGNSQVHNQVVSFDDTQAAYVLPSPTPAPRPLYFRSAPPSPCSPNPYTTLIVVQSPSSPPPTSPQLLALQGPAGKAEYRIVALDDPTPQGIGASILYDEWRVVENGGRILLRYGEDPSGLNHWVLAKRSWGWILWWYEPTAANMEDLGEYVMVDVEVEAVG